MYDCKLMEIRRAFFVVWMGCGALFFCGGGRMVDGGWHPSPRLFDSGREVVVAVWGFWRKCGVDEGWRIEWIPGSWMSHQRCAGWLGGKAEFPVV